MVVSHIFLNFHPYYVGKIPILTNIFQRGLKPLTSCFLLVQVCSKTRMPAGGIFGGFLEPRIAYVHEQGRPRRRPGFDFSPAKSPESQQKNQKMNVDMPHIPQNSRLQVAFRIELSNKNVVFVWKMFFFKFVAKGII